MKTFDEVLEAAFDAGRECGRDEMLADAWPSVPVYDPAPDFHTWRRTLGDSE